MENDDQKDIARDQEQAGSSIGDHSKPGDIIRIEQRVFTADNFAAAAYLLEDQVCNASLTVMTAVDVATDYVLGVRVTLVPTVDDAVELLATAMRDKNPTARKWFGLNGSWQGWCVPKTIEVGPDSPFLDNAMRERFAAGGIEVLESRSEIPDTGTMALARHACVSPIVVKKLRQAHLADRRAKRVRTKAPSQDELEDGQTYLRIAVEHALVYAACVKLQDGDAARVFLRSRGRIKAPTDHDIRVMLCPEVTVDGFEEEGIYISGHPYMNDALYALGLESGQSVTTLKFGGWNRDSISVRDENGQWFEVPTYDDDMPPAISLAEMEFADVMVNRTGSFDVEDRRSQYYHSLDWLRQQCIPVFDPFPFMRRKTLPAANHHFIRRERLVGTIAIETLVVDLANHVTGHEPSNRETKAHVFVAVDVASGYAMGVKAIMRPTEETALDLLRQTMVDRTDAARASGATSRWSAIVKPYNVFAGDEGIFSTDRLTEAVERLGGTIMDCRAPTGVDLRHLVDVAMAELSTDDGMPDAEALESHLVRQVSDRHNQTPQVALGGRTPEQAFSEISAMYEPTVIPPAHEICVALGRDYKRPIHAEGVTIEGSLFNSDLLQTLRATLGKKPAKFRFDPVSGAVSVMESEVFLQFSTWREVPRAGSGSSAHAADLRNTAWEMASAHEGETAPAPRRQIQARRLA